MLLILRFLVYQIKSESFLEDINNILNSGDVPNIYALEDLDQIYHDMKPVVLDSGQQPTKANMFSAYTKRVRSNIHLVICMRYSTMYMYIIKRITCMYMYMYMYVNYVHVCAIVTIVAHTVHVHVHVKCSCIIVLYTSV